MAKKKTAPKTPTVFEHKRSQSEHEESGSISFYEHRGVRDASNLFLFSDFAETFQIGNYNGAAEEDVYASLREASGHWLKEFGEKDFGDIAIEAEKAKAKVQGKKKRKEIDRHVFQRWAFEIGMRQGFLSPAAVAANFVSTADHVHRLANGNDELLRAVYQFAQAWHWMHFEGYGEHELAALGLRSAAGRTKGPEVKKERKGLRLRIVEDLYRRYQENDSVPASSRRSPKRAASALLTEVNARLRELDIDLVSEGRLEKDIREIGNSGGSDD